MSSFSDPWLPGPGALGVVPSIRDATDVAVFRVVLDSVTNLPSSLTPLDSLVCLAIDQHEGPAPSLAIFRYVFDGRNPASPQSWEAATSTAVTKAMLPDLIEVGDWLCVVATQPDGDAFCIFSGKAKTWASAFDDQRDSVIIEALGIEEECWATPVQGALMRTSEDPEGLTTPEPVDVPCGLIPQFNQRGVPNASPSTADSGTVSKHYPVLMDPDCTGTDADGNEYPRMFDLPMAVSNLLYINNKDELFIANPTRAALNNLLIARQPIDGTPFDPTDPSTYTSAPIQASDIPQRGRPWPMLIHSLVKDSGFGLRFPLTTSSFGLPQTKLELFLKQGSPPKPLLLQARYTPFDPSQTNTGRAELHRDLACVVNRWIVRGALKRYEASFVLCPGFPSQSSDSATGVALEAFRKTADGFPTTDAYNAYRLWICAEDGGKYYKNDSTVEISGVATTLNGVLGSPIPNPDPTLPDIPQYVARARKPIEQLFSVDSTGLPLNYRLSISKDYTGPYPAVWDGTGTWRLVEGGYQVLKDRLGIYVNITNPNNWFIGTSAAGTPFSSGKINAVEMIGNPTATNPAFFLRLTCVIEGDNPLEYIADNQDTSPWPTAITREIDASDRMVYQEISPKSEFNNTPDPTTGVVDPIVVRDDTLLAQAEALAQRTATEAGLMEGTVEVPHFTTIYGIGDRISGIQGRNVGLRTDTGGEGYAPVLPIVVSVRWDFSDGQKTYLHVSDAGIDRRRYARRFGRPEGIDKQSREERQQKAREVAALARQIQKAGFGVSTSNFGKL
jgi:hypothetical protein